MPLSNFRIRWRADQVDPRYILNPTNSDPVYQINITDDDIPENLEYFEIDLIPNPGGNGNSFFYPNAVGRVTIIDDDTRKLLVYTLINPQRMRCRVTVLGLCVCLSVCVCVCVCVCLLVAMLVIC